MAYSNRFLRDFRPIFFGILREKGIEPHRVEVEVLDEEPEGEGIFEPVGVREVLEQLSDDLNYLTVYTERPAYFYEFAEKMYQENGLIVRLFFKKDFFPAVGRNRGDTLVLDFEWEGNCYLGQMRPGKYYIPIHKKPWETCTGGNPGDARLGGCSERAGENLDIAVPIGYNTVIVKGVQERRRAPGRDRLEEAFYKK